MEGSTREIFGYHVARSGAGTDRHCRSDEGTHITEQEHHYAMGAAG